MSKWIMTDDAYDVLKFVAQILLPAAGTLYAALAGLWGLPEPQAVVGTITAIDTFLGAILAYASKKYNGQEDE